MPAMRSPLSVLSSNIPRATANSTHVNAAGSFASASAENAPARRTPLKASLTTNLKKFINFKGSRAKASGIPQCITHAKAASSPPAVALVTPPPVSFTSIPTHDVSPTTTLEIPTAGPAVTHKFGYKLIPLTSAAATSCIAHRKEAFEVRSDALKDCPLPTPFIIHHEFGTTTVTLWEALERRRAGGDITKRLGWQTLAGAPVRRVRERSPTGLITPLATVSSTTPALGPSRTQKLTPAAPSRVAEEAAYNDVDLMSTCASAGSLCDDDNGARATYASHAKAAADASRVRREVRFRFPDPVLEHMVASLNAAPQFRTRSRRADGRVGTKRIASEFAWVGVETRGQEYNCRRVGRVSKKTHLRGVAC